MKRLLILFVLVAFIAAIPLSHSLRAEKPAKFKICQLTHDDGLKFHGHVIIVAESAVAAHYRQGNFDPRSCKNREKGDPCVLGKHLDITRWQNYKCKVE